MKVSLKRTFILLLSILLILSLASCKKGGGSDGKEIASVNIDPGSLKTELTVGETLDTSGIKLVITYKDDSTEVITADKIAAEDIGTIDTSTPGDKTLEVKYGGFVATITIKVKAPVTVTGIEIDGSYPKSVKLGEALDLSGLIAKVTYSDGTTKTVGYSELTVTAPDTATEGEKTLTVAYQGVSSTATVEVIGIASITVVQGKLPSEVAIGATIDTSAIEIIVTYTNGDKKTVQAKDLSVSSIDTSVMGDKEITVTYMGKEAKWPVKVVGIESLEIIGAPEKAYVLSSLDTSKIQVKAIYNNGNEVPLERDDYTLSFDASTAGTKKLTATLVGSTLKAEVDIEVLGVLNIKVIGNTYSKEVLLGGSIDLSGLKVLVTYTDADKSTAEVPASKLQITYPSTDTAGDKVINVKYLDGSADIPVKVCGIKELVIEGCPISVPAGEEPDFSKLTVKLVYSDSKGSFIVLNAADYTTNLNELDFNQEGDKIFKVTYNGDLGKFEAQKTISTTPPELVGLEITCDKYVPVLGTYDKSSIRVYAVYGNGERDEITAGYTVSDVSTDTAGTVTLTVSYTDGESVTVTATETISVLPVTKLNISGLDTKIKLGTTIESSSLTVIATFSDGTYEVVEQVNAQISADLSAAGKTAVTVSYAGYSCDYSVEVIAPASIRPLTGSYDAGLREGYTPDASNLKIEITYTDGITKEIISAAANADIAYSYYQSEGKTYFKVEAYGCEYSQAVKSITIKETSALNGTVPTTIFVGEGLPDTMKLTVIYVDEDGNEYVYLIGLDDPKLNVTLPEDTSTPGMKAIIFEYAGYTTQVNVTVRGIKSLEVVDGSVDKIVIVGNTLDTSKILVKVEYDVGDENANPYTYIGINDANLTVGTVDTSSAGKKYLEISYMGATATYEITVQSESAFTGDIYNIELPTNITERESYKKNFKDQTYAYYVGDDNPYLFYVNVLMLDENDKPVKADGKIVPTTTKVYLINTETGEETELTGDALTAMVVKNEANNTYDFTEAAIGKTFRLEIQPRDNYYGKPKSHTVEIVDAYNIYDAKELNIVTNTPDNDLDGSFREEDLDQLTAAKNFLAKHNIAYPEVLHGIVLHGNLNITLADIPEEYVYTYVKDGVTKQGLYDWEYVYYRTNTPASPEFTMYGNYYSIYSYNIPCVSEAGYANNDDAFSSSSLFYFDAYDDFDTKGIENFDHTKFKTTVKGVSFRDDDPNSNDQSASQRHMLGIACIRSSYQVINIVNTNIEAYNVSMVPECDDQTVYLTQVKFYNAWQGHLFLWNTNTLQDDYGNENAAPRAGHQNMKIYITDSLLGKCGGPVILSQTANPELPCNAATGADIVVDDKSELYSYVTGQEAWFVAVGQTAMAMKVLTIDIPISGTAQAYGMSASFIANDKIAGVNTVNMIYVNMGTGTDPTQGSVTDFHGSFTRAGVTLNDMTTSNTALPEYIGAANQYVAQDGTKGPWPVLQSSSGAMAFATNDGCLSLDETYGPYPNPAFFTGDYISIYYYGMGIVLEYYH